jgi:hypothetical protein
MPTSDHLFGQIRTNAARARGRMVLHDSALGQHIVICGAGPSLRAVTELPKADEIWACNSALPYLIDHGLPVTHGFTVDQGAAMARPMEWGRADDVCYYVPSSAHPNLLDVLESHNRDLRFFHSFLGIPDEADWVPKKDRLGKWVTSQEMWLYRSLYDQSVQVGHGLNSVPRAVCLALAMGASRITIYGADCGMPDGPPAPEFGTPAYADWVNGLVMYADGRTVGQCYGVDQPVAEAVLDGRRWHTRVDMAVSATHLHELRKGFPDRVIEFVGDTLPNAMRVDDPEFMACMPFLGGGPGVVDGFSPPFPVEETVS